MNYTSLWEMRLGHFCLLWAIYVFFFFFLDTLLLVTPLRLFNWHFFLKALIHSVSRWNLISLFQCSGLCENSKKKEKKIQRKKKKRERKKGKVPKRRKLKGFSSNFEKWNGRKEHCFEEVEVKKKCWMQIPKRVDIPTNLENTSYIYLHPFFISIASRSSN